MVDHIVVADIKEALETVPDHEIVDRIAKIIYRGGRTISDLIRLGAVDDDDLEAYLCDKYEVEDLVKSSKISTERLISILTDEDKVKIAMSINWKTVAENSAAVKHPAKGRGKKGKK